MDTFITLKEASQRYGVSPSDLRHLLERDRIPVARFNGEVLVADNGELKQALEEMRRRRSIEASLRARFAHLQGVEIGIAEAARKYHLPQPTIGRWVKAGYITRLGQDGQKILIDEGDVAYCEAVYRRQGGGRGKRIFDKDGRPYQLKHPARSENYTATA